MWVKSMHFQIFEICARFDNLSQCFLVSVDHQFHVGLSRDKAFRHSYNQPVKKSMSREMLDFSKFPFPELRKRFVRFYFSCQF